MVLDGLDPNTEYYVNVTAVTDTFESDASNGLRVVTLLVTGETGVMCVVLGISVGVSVRLCVTLVFL